MELTVDTSLKAGRAVRDGAEYAGASVSGESREVSVEAVIVAGVAIDLSDATIEFTVEASENADSGAAVGYIAISGSELVSPKTATVEELNGYSLPILDVVVVPGSSGVVLFR